MERKQIATAAAAAIALLPTLFASALFPSLRLLYAVPFLVWLYYSLPLSKALWASFGIGLLLDLLSSSHSFGTFALIYCATTSVVYRLKPRFYAHRWTTLPILTWTFALISTLFQVALFALTGRSGGLSLPWIFTDLLLFPLADALWALVGLSLPLHLLQLRRKVEQPIRLSRPH